MQPMVQQQQDRICPEGHRFVRRVDDNKVGSRFYCPICDRVGSENGPRYAGGDIEIDELEDYSPERFPSRVVEIEDVLNVHGKILPLDRWKYDRINIGIEFHKFLEEIPPTLREFRVASIVERTELPERLGYSANGIPDPMYIAHNIQPVPKDAGGSRLLMNPGYVHYDSVGPSIPVPEDEIAYWARIYAKMAKVSPETAERNLGIDNVRDYINWDEIRADAHTKVANTIFVSSVWSEYTIEDVSYAFGFGREEGVELVETHAEQMIVPPDPSKDGRFGTGAVGTVWEDYEYLRLRGGQIVSD